MECVKAFTAIGQNSPYGIPVSTLAESAPLLFLDPSSESSCPQCCESLQSSSSSDSFVPLSPAASSLVANRTVVFLSTDLASCKPRIAPVMGLETTFLSLTRAGAKAVIFVCGEKTPGLAANFVGTISEADVKAARNSMVPFAAIGAEDGRRLIDRLVEDSEDSDGHSEGHDIHATFFYDENKYLVAYQSYVELPFKVVCFLFFAFMVCRLHYLGLRFYSSTGYLSYLPRVDSTKNLVVCMAVPTVASIVVAVSTNGLLFLDERSKGWVFLSVCSTFPCLNVASSFLVANFWRARQAPHAPHARVYSEGCPSAQAPNDPAKTEPIKTLCIVAFAVCGELVTFASYHFSIVVPKEVITTIAIPLTAGYLLTTAYFFRSGVQIFRSLSASERLSASSCESNAGFKALYKKKALNALYRYMLSMGVFSLMIIAAAFSVGFGAWESSVDAFFLSAALYYVGQYGITLCHLFVFTGRNYNSRTPRTPTMAPVLSGSSASSIGIIGIGSKQPGGVALHRESRPAAVIFAVSSDETFLESENRTLRESNNLKNAAIAQLSKENSAIKQNAELEARLLGATLDQAQINSKLLKEQRVSKTHNAKASFRAALKEVKNPLDGIFIGLERACALSDAVFENPNREERETESEAHESEAPSPPSLSALKAELKNIQACASHQDLILKSASELDTYITRNSRIPMQLFIPTRLCRDAVAAQARSSRPGVEVTFVSTGLSDDDVFEGAPSQLNLVLRNLLSSAANFRGNGKVELSVTVAERSEFHQVLRFAVTDTGPEVPEKLKSMFFGKQRAKNAKNSSLVVTEGEQIESYGFGLQVAYELVKRMRGLLLLKSPVFPVFVEKGGEGEKGEEGEEEEERAGRGGSELSVTVSLLKAGSLGTSLAVDSAPYSALEEEETGAQREQKRAANKWKSYSGQRKLKLKSSVREDFKQELRQEQQQKKKPRQRLRSRESNSEEWEKPATYYDQDSR